VEKWQDGDITAFEELFRKHHQAVFRTAYLMAGSKEAAEDILQEVFLAVWRFRGTFDPAKSRLSTWLNRITVNQCFRNNHNGDKHNFESIEELEIPEAQCRQPEEILVTHAEYKKLLSTLAEMDKNNRAVLVLRYFNDMSYPEIADALDFPRGTVKSRLNQGLSYLKEKFAAAESGA